VGLVGDKGKWRGGRGCMIGEEDWLVGGEGGVGEGGGGV